MTQLETVRTVETVAAEIRALTASMLCNVIEIGRRMCEVKETLPYGEFGKWIEENTGYSNSTANNFMRLFQEYGAAQSSLFGAEVECQTIGKLSYTKALALLALPPAERETFVEENHVEEMSTRELKKAIRERDEANRRAQEAEQAAEGSALAMAELQEKLDEAAAREKNADYVAEELRKQLAAAEQKAADARRVLDELAQENEQLRGRPADVAIQYQTDPAEIEAAARKARDEEQAKYQKKLQLAEKTAKLSREQQEKAEATLKAAEAEVEALRERLEKQVAMADPVTAEFKGLFEQTSAMVLKLRQLADAAPEGSREKLKKALQALAGQMEGV